MPSFAEMARSSFIDVLDTKLLRVPHEPQRIGRRHVPDQRRRGDDDRAGKVTLAAHAHPVLPVAIEGRNGALAWTERVRPLAETRATPRLPNLPADRPQHPGDRFAAEPRVRLLDAAADA